MVPVLLVPQDAGLPLRSAQTDRQARQVALTLSRID